MDKINLKEFKVGGHRLGVHRVIEPKGVLPQQAKKIDNSLPIYENEILIDVESLNIDSASFYQIKNACNSEEQKMKAHILELVETQGKHHNPVTGSGGMLIGKVLQIGPKFFNENNHNEDLKVGDRIATLVSLTLTPLKIYEIKKIYLDLDRVDIKGHAVLFQSGIYAKLPNDISDTLSLAVLDVCGAPATTASVCKEGQTVVIVGGGGKSGILCAYEAKKKVGSQGRIICLDYLKEAVSLASSFSFVDKAIQVDARDALKVLEIVEKETNGKLADVVINVANVPDTEMSCILSCKRGGLVYFFSMATSFTKAALGAEGVGAHLNLMIGNGYYPGHAELALNILRESKEIRDFYEKKYG